MTEPLGGGCGFGSKWVFVLFLILILLLFVDE